jgi:hypothetical protein
MRVVGMLATTAGLAALVGIGVLTARSMPDLRRYLRIRSM